jgi:hypothetical protein
MTADLAELERQARERGTDYDPSGRYVYDPDADAAELELVGDIGGLTELERAEARERERSFAERIAGGAHCVVCGRALAGGQPGDRHGSCSPTCEDCSRPAVYCSCSATVRRKRAAAAP